QGYYDVSAIGSDVFDQAVRVSIEGDSSVSPEMEAKGIRLTTSVATSIGYVAFNWDDPVVGGQKPGEAAERARKLRHAISIAFDVEEQITIFAYVEGRPGINPVMYDWVGDKPQRKSLETAKKLLAEAGYPNGRDARTGQ